MRRAILVAAVLFSTVTSTAQQKAPLLTDVFVAGDGRYHTYRIPSAIVTPKGTNDREKRRWGRLHCEVTQIHFHWCPSGLQHAPYTEVA
jgi:hypothetical protein